MIGRYVCTAWRFRAVAAALRARLTESFHGEVPSVKTPGAETTLWKVHVFGREIRADWFLIQSSRTDSNELA